MLFFVGNATTNKILKLQLLLSNNFVVIAQAPTLINSDSNVFIFCLQGLGFESCNFKEAANRWRFESLRTANRDSRHLRTEDLGDRIQGPSWRQQQRQKPPVLALCGPNFEANPRWLKVAYSGLEWPKVA